MTIFLIEGEAHSELCGEFPNYKSTLAELEKRAQIPWDEKARTQILEVSSSGIVWSKE